MLPITGLAALPAVLPAVLPTPAPTPSPTLVRDVDCIVDGGTLCQVVLDVTGDPTLARAADWLVAKPLAIVLIVALALLLRAVLRRLVDRVVQRIAEGRSPTGKLRAGRTRDLVESASPLATVRRRQRSEAMGSVLKSSASFAIFVIAGLMVLSELGLDLAPLIASAGIAGIALGFGAQNLVKDFLAGVFMIFEDQYGVGDVIDTGEATGSVEAVGLRVTQLRDVDGVVWYVRNGEVIRIGNKSQGWARAVLDIGVGYGEDIAMVRTLLKEVADTLWRDPEWADLVVEEPEVWGVEAMGPDAVLVRVTVKTQPLEQWKVARELRERIKAAFDERGIEIPFPQRTVWMRTEGPGTAPPAPAPAPDAPDAPDAVPAPP